MLEFIDQEIESLRASGLHRELRTIEKIDGSRITINGKEYINFCSNNYLGLANHPKVVEASQIAAKEFGTSAGASRLICGNLSIHQQLEEKLAKFKKRKAAIIFPTGYMANLGVISTLLDENDTVIIDRLDHASIIDACRLSKAKLQVYPHKDMQALEKVLSRSGIFKKRLIVTESIFSMDGDIVPLPEIIKLAKKHQAITMIDEAHATGVLGKTGRGIEEYFGVKGEVDIVMGTLSKALGSLGGFVAGSTKLIDYLKNKARSFIYTTALPPSACASAIAALEIIEAQPELVEKLRINSRLLKGKLSISSSDDTPILPIIIGDPKKTMEISNLLFEKGFFISGIRPPTVPENESRLRITVSTIHSKEEIACLASSLQELILE